MDKKKEYTAIETITLEDLMKSDEHLDWRINNFLPKGCIGVVSGITGVKRSYFLQQMALALSTGENFLDFTIPNKNRVLFYEAELTKGQLKTRAASMLKIYPSTQDVLFNNKYALRLDHEDGPGLLIYTMHELEIDVCILDPLYMMHSSNINDERDAMRMLNPLETYCLETGNNIVIASHSTKVYENTNQKPNRTVSGGAVKGSSSQVQVAAYVWSLSDSFLPTTEGYLIYEKTRDMPKPEKLPLKFREDTKTFLPKVTSDDKRLEYLRRKQPKDRAEANKLLENWYAIKESKAYEVSGQYFKEQEPVVAS